MKTVFTLLTVFLFTFSPEAQIIGFWTPPVALTDSTSDNSNPVVVVLQDELYMIYNKYDEPYREVWWRKISEPMTEEQMLVGGWPEIDYRNPQIVYNFLVCEINLQGQYDLFGFRIDTSGLLDSGFQITNTGYDENSFNVYNDYYEGLCCWVGEGSIYVAEPQVIQDTLFLTDIQIVDSGECYDPVNWWNYIAWRKIENNESHVYYSEKSWPSYQWSNPEAVIDTGNNFNLSLSIFAPVIGTEPNLWWEANNKIYKGDLDGGLSFYCPEIPGVDKYHDPTAFEIIWLTDYYDGVYSFVGETGTIGDIYIVDEEMSNYILNITDDPNIDKDPRLFIGRPTYEYSTFYEIIDIWQKEINGHDVLYGSFALYNVVIGNIDKNELSQLKIFPDPVSDQMTIQFNLNGSAMTSCDISILNNCGIMVDEIKTVNLLSHVNKVIWNKGDLPTGVYYVLVRTKNETLTEKFIIH